MNLATTARLASILEKLEEYLKKLFVALLGAVVRPGKATILPKELIKNILVVRQHDQLGDMLCAVPLLRALRTNFPSAHITLVAGEKNYEIMLNHPYLNGVLKYDKRSYFKNPFTLWNFFRLLRESAFDLAVVPSTVSISLTSNLIALLSGATVRIGPKGLHGIPHASSLCFNTAVDLDWSATPGKHQTLRNLDILSPLGIGTDDLAPIIGFTSEEIEFSKKYLSQFRSQHAYLIGIHPGAGKVKNRWRPECFALLANQLQEKQNAGVIITAGPMDDEALNQMLQHLKCNHVLVHNKPIRHVAAIIDQLDLFITNDTGIMHVAAATRSALLALFGPTDPEQWAPKGQKNHYISAKNANIDTIPGDLVYDATCQILGNLKRI